MRLSRILGLTVATAAILAIAASSASAVTLCEEAKNPCPEPKEFAVPTILGGELNPLFEMEIVVFDKAAEEKGEMEKPFFTIKCSKGTFKGATSKNEGPEKTLLGTITPEPFEGCTGCTKGVALKAPYKTELLWDPAVVGDGLLNITTGTGGGIPAWEFTGCGPLSVTCTFGENTISKIRWMGANPAQIRITNAPLTFQAGNPTYCQKKAKVTAWYNVTNPALPVYVVAKP
jgi:hypothetical protein